MARRKTGQRPPKSHIVVFCEGESEQAYLEFLKKEFIDVASFRSHICTNLFEEADSKFKKDKNYRDNAEVTNEIWFFFDVETKDIEKWENRLKIIQRLRSLRKKPGIKVRLLMTTGCIEYWLMLHFKMCCPPLQTDAQKNQMISQLSAIVPDYKKGNLMVTLKIAEKNYRIASDRAQKTVSQLVQQGLPSIEDTDERNRWLCQKCFTFSTVYEAINFLLDLRAKKP